MPKNPLASVGLLAAIVAAVAALSPMQALSATTAGTTSSLASLRAGILVDLNNIRVSHGLVPLKLNAALSAAASQHTSEMLADGYFAHNSYDGTAFWKRIQTFYPSAQYKYWSVGENLLWTGGPLDAQGALEMWMASPEHRANILTPNWRDIGIAVQYESNAPGAFDDYDVTVAATDFGTRN
ncbi:MAG: hypothetical protein JO186_07685 [Actinobacteria bacterium]|nr:hypothetical protein [Actinomycetota bacterium]MBV8395141.1 hypothetical protein [Actinomycetota bacterium]